MQVPRNHQVLINQLPVHVRHGEAELYQEVRIGNQIHFKPVEEFISLKIDKNEEEDNQINVNKISTDPDDKEIINSNNNKLE